ncbi:hypothetical protein HMPREF3150_03345 [Pseudomonas aeruginosa]|nr:hypothetical protein HMPREF3150_03345 [Pseudomonas aeruginosa]
MAYGAQTSMKIIFLLPALGETLLSDPTPASCPCTQRPSG